ncbi:MAG TPA: hypothetical protein VF988_09215, partial [Verrucomicrobiae bacterium]
IPEGPMDWGHAQRRSLIAKHMLTLPMFEDVTEQWITTRVYAAGDMVGFSVGGCIHHCAIITSSNGAFIHATREFGTFLSNLNDATYFSRIGKIWRPLVHASPCQSMSVHDRP